MKNERMKEKKGRSIKKLFANKKPKPFFKGLRVTEIMINYLVGRN